MTLPLYKLLLWDLWTTFRSPVGKSEKDDVALEPEFILISYNKQERLGVNAKGVYSLVQVAVSMTVEP